MTSDEKIGRDGKPWDLERVPRELLKARPGEPGHDDRLNAETVRRRFGSRFEKYGYRRLNKTQINAFEWFSGLCEVVAAGSLSHSRYGKEMGSIDGASFGSRDYTDRIMSCAALRRQCISRINGVKHDPKDDAQGQDAWRALKWAVEDDLTPREIGERLITRRSGYPLPTDKSSRDSECIAIGMFHLTDAIAVLIDVSTGRKKWVNAKNG